MVKNPNRFSVAEDLNKGLQITIQLAVRAGLELGLELGKSGALTTRLRRLFNKKAVIDFSKQIRSNSHHVRKQSRPTNTPVGKT